MRANKYGEENTIQGSVSMIKQHNGLSILKQLIQRSSITTTLSTMFTVCFDKDLHSTKYGERNSTPIHEMRKCMRRTCKDMHL